jgi:hypothetical protein
MPVPALLLYPETGGTIDDLPDDGEKVELLRAIRSILVTVTTSPGPMALSIFNSSRRSARAPVTFSRYICVHPTAQAAHRASAPRC